MYLAMIMKTEGEDRGTNKMQLSLFTLHSWCTVTRA